MILGSLLDEAGEEAIRFGLAATFVRGELDSMQPQVWLHGFTGREAVNAVKAVGQRLSRLDTVLRIAVQAQLTTGMVLFHETAGAGGKRRSQASRIVVGPKPTDVTIHKDLFRDLVGGLRVLVQSVEPKPQNRRQTHVAAGMGNSLDLVTFTIPSNLYFAQFADGGGLFSQIILYALQNERDTKALISLKGIGGQPQTVDLNGEDVEGELEVMIPAGGLRRFKTDGEGPISVASVTVTSDAPLAGVVVFGGLVGLAGVGSSEALDNGFRAPMETNSAGSINTGIAVMNLENDQLTLDLQLCDRDDNPVASAQISLAAMGQLAKFVTEFNWDKAADFSDFEGTLKVTGDGRIAATVIQTRPTQFATMPVSAL